MQNTQQRLTPETANLARWYLLDENISKQVLLTLRQAGFTASRVIDEKLNGVRDSVIFRHARAQQKTIITFDAGYLEFPKPHAGLFVLRYFDYRTTQAQYARAILTALQTVRNTNISNTAYVIRPEGLYLARKSEKVEVID